MILISCFPLYSRITYIYSIKLLIPLLIVLKKNISISIINTITINMFSLKNIDADAKKIYTEPSKTIISPSHFEKTFLSFTLENSNLLFKTEKLSTTNFNNGNFFFNNTTIPKTTSKAPHNNIK